MKTQILGKKVWLKCKGKTLLGLVNKLFAFPLIVWIFKEGEGDGIESRLSFKTFSTLKKAQVLELKGFTTDEQNSESESDDEEQEPGRLKRSEVIDFQVQLKSKSSEESSSADETSDSGAKYLVIFSSRSLKMTEKYISFSQFVYFLREVSLLFNFWMIKLTIMFFWHNCEFYHSKIEK